MVSKLKQLAIAGSLFAFTLSGCATIKETIQEVTKHPTVTLDRWGVYRLHSNTYWNNSQFHTCVIVLSKSLQTRPKYKEKIILK